MKSICWFWIHLFIFSITGKFAMTVAEVALSSLPITICDISHEVPATYMSCDFTYGLNKIKFDMLKETTFMR